MLRFLLDIEKEFTQTELTNFSTLDIEKFYDDYFSQKRSLKTPLLKYLDPIKEFKNVKAGDLFAIRYYDILAKNTKINYQSSIGGHIGVITKIINESHFE